MKPWFAILLVILAFVAGLFVGSRFIGGTDVTDVLDKLHISEDKWAPISRQVADTGLSNYRKSGALASLGILHAKGKSHGVVHDSASAALFDTLEYKQFTRTHPAKDGYVWGLGYYFEVCNDKMHDNTTRPRLSIYLIPTMCKFDPVIKSRAVEVLDYDSLMTTKDSTYYTGTLTALTGTTTGGQYIYNQGTIFP